MKTRLLTIFSAITLLLSSCTNLNDKRLTDLDELNVKGKVKSITVKSFEAEEKFGKAVKTTIEDFYKEMFDENGFVTEMHIFNTEELKVGTSFYKYDEKGNMNESIFAFEIGSNKGDKIKRSSKSTYTYNERGFRVEENKYSTEGLFETKVTYTYNENNLNIEQNTYNANGELIGKETYKYNKDRQVTESKSYLIENGSEHNSTTEFWYNDKGDRSKMRFVSIDKFAHVDILSSFEYEYDEKENWIKEIVYSEDSSERKPFKITEREIVYYK
ncbi:hypothetical protein [Paenimyroides baculatum]|uniref:YD repeat-containing protein n=1 Tax=Paenimyroides baculatum TaxID=2608000 RepID=A0A5M6C9P6_9FLAO|nr:hypothetical protein [Paenimyroides baculatum]KAA5531877.1 hypothetical protein F0460_14775 [Paenimyroides baculatum]